MRLPPWVYAVGIGLYLTFLLLLVLDVMSDKPQDSAPVDGVLMCSPSYPC